MRPARKLRPSDQVKVVGARYPFRFSYKLNFPSARAKSWHVTPLRGEARLERAAAELDVLVRFSFAAEDDRIGNDVADRQRRAEAEEPVLPRRPVDAEGWIGDAGERFGAVVDVAVRRHERLAGQRRVADVHVLHVVRHSQRELRAVPESVVGLQFEMRDAERHDMLVRRDECRRTFRRDVGTLSDVRGEERSFRRRERHAPMIGADDAGLTRSAGEVWIRSGGSGE